MITIDRWSPLHELVPDTPLRHGHAISIDMAFSATLANSRGLIDDVEHRRILTLFSRAGLSMDHPQFDEAILHKGTAAILKTRDGKLRAAVPHPIGSCIFLNDVGAEEMNAALRRHKQIMQDYPRHGEGLEAYVDASDTGYTENHLDETVATHIAAGKVEEMNGSMMTSSTSNGATTAAAATTNGVDNGKDYDTSVVNGVNGANGTNGVSSEHSAKMANGSPDGCR